MLKTKTLTAVILIAALAVSLACLGAFATVASADEVTAVTTGFELEGNTVVGFTLPESVSGEFKAVLPTGVTAIGERAFEGNLNLVAVELPASLQSIGSYAFARTGLRSVTIPAGVTSVGQHAFRECSALSDVTFAERTAEQLEIGIFAFDQCIGLKTLILPAKTTVRQRAFQGCSSLLWVYLGQNCAFVSPEDQTFFPTNTQLSIVFPDAASYKRMITLPEFAAFRANHGTRATYVIKVNAFVGSSKTPTVYERLHGREFNYVKDGSSLNWNVDTKFSALPVQHESYSSTVWYTEANFANAVSYADVNALLNSDKTEINLYCHETVLAPVFPAEPVSWRYDAKISYDSSDVYQVLQALGCKQQFTQEQLSAMDFDLVFADEKGVVADTPQAINANGVYSVTFTLDPAYGVWAQTVASSVTVNVNTSGFNTVLAVLIILGTVGLAATASTAIIRQRIQKRNRRKQLTNKEVLEKFKAVGGESPLIK